jgi:hypothetical protein
MKLRNHSGIATFGTFSRRISSTSQVGLALSYFCSYGSVSTPGKDIPGGTPTDLKGAARMTLWPRKVKERMEVNGLLLDWDEFNEVVLQFNKELAIDSDLSQKIFELTAGHVGAVCGLLRLILDKACSLYNALCFVSPLTLALDENTHTKRRTAHA